MRRFEATIDMAEVPVIDTLDALYAATATLATENTAYAVAESIETPYSPITQDGRKINSLVYHLNQSSHGWIAGRSRTRTVDAASDLGMHGNPYEPGDLTDYLHYHRTPFVEGGLVVTFADATPAYLHDQVEANRRLTALLAEGKTDTRYADPESFRQVALGAGGVVLFRLNEGQNGLPLLHSFRTVGGGIREAEITPIYRPEVPEMDFDDSVGSMLNTVMRWALRRGR